MVIAFMLNFDFYQPGFIGLIEQKWDIKIRLYLFYIVIIFIMLLFDTQIIKKIEEKKNKISDLLLVKRY